MVDALLEGGLLVVLVLLLFVAELRTTAEQAVRVDLALRAVVEAEGIEASDEDLEAEYAQVAERVGQKTEQVRRQFERNEQVPLVRSDIKRRKALDWLLEHVETVDEDGNAIDRTLLKIDDEPTEDTADAADAASVSDSGDEEE